MRAQVSSRFRRADCVVDLLVMGVVAVYYSVSNDEMWVCRQRTVQVAEKKVEAGKIATSGFHSFRVYKYVHLYSKLGTSQFVAMCRPTASTNRVLFSNSRNSTWELHTYRSSHTLCTHTHRPSCASHVPSVPSSSIPCTQSNCGLCSLA